MSQKTYCPFAVVPFSNAVPKLSALAIFHDDVNVCVIFQSLFELGYIEDSFQTLQDCNLQDVKTSEFCQSLLQSSQGFKIATWVEFLQACQSILPRSHEAKKHNTRQQSKKAYDCTGWDV